MEFLGRLGFNRRRSAAAQYIIDRAKAGLFALEIIFISDSGAFRMQLLGRFGKGNRLRYFPDRIDERPPSDAILPRVQFDRTSDVPV